MEQVKIDRINELARKSKTEAGLTPEEKEEQAAVQEAAVSAFAPAGGIPAEPEGMVEDPFAGDAFEDDSDTRVLNLDDLQFGPNYTKD